MEVPKKKSPALLVLFIVFTVLYAVIYLTYGQIVWGRYGLWSRALGAMAKAYAASAAVVLAVVFSGKGVKPAAIPFAVLYLLVCIYDLIRSFRYFYGIDWLLSYADEIVLVVLGLLILLNAVGVIKNRKALAIVLFVTGGGAVMYNLFAFFMRYGSRWDARWFVESLMFSSIYWLSRLCLHLALGFGMLRFTPGPGRNTRNPSM